MVKKKGGTIGKIINSSAKDFFSYLSKSLEKKVEDSYGQFKEFLDIKDKLRRISYYNTFMTAAAVIFFFGIAMAINSLLPKMNPGITFLALGAVIFCAVWLARNMDDKI